MSIAPELPAETSVDDNIRRVIALLCTYRGLTQLELGKRVGIAKGPMSLRMNGKRPFKAAEIARLAVVLGAPVQAFYDGPEALFARPAPSMITRVDNAHNTKYVRAAGARIRAVACKESAAAHRRMSDLVPLPTRPDRHRDFSLLIDAPAA